MNSYLVSQRPYYYQHNLSEELSFDNRSNYLFELSYLAGLSVNGPGTLECLQGQLSCDMREVSPTVIRQGALCNLKGRALTLVDVLQWNGFHLLMPKDLLVETKQSLEKVALLSRLELKDFKPNFYGLYLNNLEDLPPALLLPKNPYEAVQTESYYCYSLGQNFYMLLTQSKNLPALFDSLKMTHRGDLAWHYLQLRRGLIQIYPSSRGIFLPHRLNLHNLGYLNFNKGCYKGQEIIARMHYRGKMKHELKLFSLQTDSTLFPGLKLFNVDKQEVGEILDFCPMSAGRFLIVASMLLDYFQPIILDGQETALESIALRSYP